VEAAQPSAIGNEAPLWMAVSPDYPRTHMVAAVAAPVGGCSASCTHVWVSRDGGATWHRTAALSGAAGRLLIVHDATSGGEVLVAEMSDAVAESRDDGATWTAVGPAGVPTAYGEAVLVAGPDYVLSRNGRRDISGSGGADVDVAFDVSDRGALLAAQDAHSGAPLVLQCDAVLRCANPFTLVGSDPRTASDISLLRDAQGVVYARTGSALYRSVDAGRSFLPIPLPARANGAVYTTISAAALGVGAAAHRPLYVALLEMVGTGRSRLTAGGVYQSTDGGARWRAVGSPGPLDGGATTVAALPDGRLLAGYVDAHGDAGLVCSADGRRWDASCPPAPGGCACASATATSQQGSAPGAPTRQMAHSAVPSQSQAMSSSAAAVSAAAAPHPTESGGRLRAALVVAAGGGAALALLSTARRLRPRS
jgi:photosystem II stability/assembly factor-like uncharacterized protein